MMASSSVAGDTEARAATLTPRAERTLRQACDSFLEDRLKDPEQQQNAMKLDPEKTFQQTRKMVMKLGVSSAEDLASLSDEVWRKSKLPAALLRYVREAASRTEEPATAGFHLAPQRPQSQLHDYNSTTGSNEVQLCVPEPSFGGKGLDKINLLANHFVLSVANSPNAQWIAWHVSFSVAAKARPPGRAVRAHAMEKLMKAYPPEWLYDGSARLYTLKNAPAEQLANFCSTHDVNLNDNKTPLKVDICEAIDDTTRKQQELDLSRLKNLRNISRAKSEWSDPIDGVRIELQFLQIAMRSFAVNDLKLIARGRRIVSPEAGRLVDIGDVALKHGRELWMGYLANVEVIDGGQNQNPRCTLSLNLSASVGLPEISAIKLLAHFLAGAGTSNKYPRDYIDYVTYYEREMNKNKWPAELDNDMLRTLNSESGLRKLRVQCDYFGYARKMTVVGISNMPAKSLEFYYEPEKRYYNVAEYFNTKKGPFWWRGEEYPSVYGELPCLALNNATNWVPIELVKVLGAEHNLMVGKLRPEYQSAISAKTTFPPSRKCQLINQILQDDRIGPRKALQEKGIDVDASMLRVTGHRLTPPVLLDENGRVTPNNYSNTVRACAPPNYAVPWALWWFTDDYTKDVQQFAKDFVRSAWERGLTFRTQPLDLETYFPWKASHNFRNKMSLKSVLSNDLEEVLSGLAKISDPCHSLLVILLPPKNQQTDDLYKSIKSLADSKCATQCLNVPPKKNGSSGLDQAKRKLNNLMVKIAGKLPKERDPSNGTAHHVRLRDPHYLLNSDSGTMVLGADVTHRAAGVSVAGVVATRDHSFSTYFSEMRAQISCALNSEKQRIRKSEERIVDLADMVEALLGRWQRAAQGRLPETVIYYRDGVSDGQFKPVLTLELNQLADAFKSVGGKDYDPKLVIIVGQKRHQTRLFREDLLSSAGQESLSWQDGQRGKSSKGNGTGKGKSKGDANENVPPGTVASRGLAQSGHLNFFLVSHQGIKGTSIPCHYHCLHLDSRLKIDAQDLERISYDLCHLYPRADKTVSYAAPAYLADHLCERGKLYLESQFPTDIDDASVASNDTKLIEEMTTRVKWFNDRQSELADSVLQGRHFFC